MQRKYNIKMNKNTSLYELIETRYGIIKKYKTSFETLDQAMIGKETFQKIEQMNQLNCKLRK